MIITKLELENIRSYKKEVINFKPGITSLSGDIGSGKSSILQAIEFAFFGFKKGDLEGIHLLRKGESKASVILTLENFKDLKIEIFREIKKSKTGINQSSAYLKLNNELIELTPSELNFRIFELLNFPKEFLTKDKNLIYRFTIYTPQEQLKEILFAQQDKRLEVIRKLFAIDKYKQLKTAIEIFYKSLKDEKNIIQAKLEPIDDSLKSLKEKLADTSQLEEKKKNIELKLQPNLEKLQKLKEQISQIEEKQEQYVYFEIKIQKQLSQIEELKLRKEELNSQLSDILNFTKEFNLEKLKEEQENLNLKILNDKKKQKELDLKKQKLKEDLTKLNKIKDDKNKLNQDIILLKNNLKHIDLVLLKCQIEDKKVELKIIDKTLRKQEKLNEELTLIKQNIEKTRTLLLEIQNKNKSVLNSINRIENLTNCPTCHQDVSKEHKKLINQDLSFELKQNLKLEEEIKLNLDKDKIKLSSLEIQLKDYNQNLANQISINDKIKDLENYLKEQDEKTNLLELELKNKEKFLLEFKSNENLDVSQEKIDLLSDELNKLNNGLLNYDFKLKEFILKQKEIESSSIKEREIKEKLTKIESNIKKENEYFEKREQIKLKQNQLKEKKSQILSLQEKLQIQKEQLNSVLVQIKTKLEFQEKIKEEYNKLIQIRQNHSTFLTNLLEQEDLLINHSLPLSDKIEKTVFTKFYVEFNEFFESIFKDLIEDNEIEVRLDSEFSIIVEQNGYDISINNLSGGEKSSLAIAYRLALKEIILNNSNQLNSLNLLILDEPTDGFSQEQVERLGNLLKENNLQQTILVSHDKKIESIADNCLYVDKKNHISEIQ